MTTGEGRNSIFIQLLQHGGSGLVRQSVSVVVFGCCTCGSCLGFTLAGNRSPIRRPGTPCGVGRAWPNGRSTEAGVKLRGDEPRSEERRVGKECRAGRWAEP